MEMPGSATCLKQMLLNDPLAPSFLKSNHLAFSTKPGTEDASSIWINSSKWVTKCFCSVLKPIWLLCFLASFLYNKNCLTCSETYWPSFFRGLRPSNNPSTSLCDTRCWRPARSLNWNLIRGSEKQRGAASCLWELQRQTVGIFRLWFSHVSCNVSSVLPALGGLAGVNFRLTAAVMLSQLFSHYI